LRTELLGSATAEAFERLESDSVDPLQAIQYILRQENLTNVAPRLFSFVHLAMWQALQANNASANPAEPGAVASKRILSYSPPNVGH